MTDKERYYDAPKNWEVYAKSNISIDWYECTNHKFLPINGVEYKIFHKTHKEIVDKAILNPNIEIIIYDTVYQKGIMSGKEFLEEYNYLDYTYKLKPIIKDQNWTQSAFSNDTKNKE